MHAIVSPEALEANKFFSLEERSKLLFEKTGLHMKPSAIAMMYKRHGITYRTARNQQRSIVRNATKHENNRIAFAKTLLSCLVNSYELAYIDETTVQVQ